MDAIERLRAEVADLRRELQSHDCSYGDTPGLILCPIDNPCTLHRLARYEGDDQPTHDSRWPGCF